MRTQTAGSSTILAALGTVLLLTTTASASSSPGVATRADGSGGSLLAFTGWTDADTEQSLLTLNTASHEVEPVARGGGIGALTWSRDGQRLFWIGYDGRQDGSSTLYSARPDGSQRQTLMTGYDIRAVTAGPDGTVAVARAGIPTNVDCATNPPTPPADLVLIDPDSGAGSRTAVRILTPAQVVTNELVFSRDDSVLLWRAIPGDPCGGSSNPQLFLTDLATGATRQVAGDAQGSGWASFSVDGTTVISAKSDGQGQDLVRTDVTSATSIRLRTPTYAEALPTFSPDGTKLAMIRTPGVPEQGIIFRPSGAPRVVITDAEGRLLRDLGEAPVSAEHLAWSPDGTFLALDGFTSVPACEGCDYGSADPAIWALPVDGDAPTQLSTAGGFASSGLAFQPTFPDPPLIERRARQLRP
ncbi:hypothetical protein GTR02_03915 [Kineococcus sp. R8]|uniref:PD40 domain-containing protein n=1 Tax=Kineococcus siccus TaxID=2696567 RepID=UPI0014129000|nr:PD40 domain-containing protein [Kineococcus siccus]NAZ80960.1 hypothetical protein [Kineococcus siccus]